MSPRIYSNIQKSWGLLGLENETCVRFLRKLKIDSPIVEHVWLVILWNAFSEITNERPFSKNEWKSFSRIF